MDGTRPIDGSWGMSEPKVDKEHRLDAKICDIEVKSASIFVVVNQILKIYLSTSLRYSKS